MKEYRENSNRTDTKQKSKNRTKKIALFAMMAVLVVSIVLMATVIVSADTYYTIRINYVFKDGTPAHDAYVATYPEGEAVDLVVTNPSIDGFEPMDSPTGGDSAATTEFHFAELDENHTATVYYVAGLTHYKVNYYKQNLYDDLYTRDNTLPASMTDRFGYTGSNPDDLESIDFPGFTNLFHEPDAIAADGSTVFRVYYDRNYYSVNFDLGEHGYGLDPIYAKYESVYHITEPKRLGYTFEGWLRTDKDSTKGAYKYATGSGAKSGKNNRSDTMWTFIDENGDELLDDLGNPLFDEHGYPIDPDLDVSRYYLNFTDGTIPAHDTHYKAMWDRGTTSYSVVYWIENPDGHDITTDDIQDPEHIHNVDEARALIAQNYTVVAAKDIHNVPSGTLVNLDTEIENAAGQTMKIKEFFKYNLSPQAVDEVDGQIVPRTDSQGRPLNKQNQVIDFPAISEAKSEELLGKEKYYDFNEDVSQLQFSGIFETDRQKTHIEVLGDGTTRLNVYYNRKDFTLKFFYARQNFENGQLTNTYSLTNSTKSFSNKDYGSNENYMEALAAGSWQSGIAESLPHVKEEYLKENGGNLEEKYIDYTDTGYSKKKYRYYYYEVEARYDAPLKGKWLIDAITIVPKKGYAGQNCEPGSWAVERFTNYYSSHISVNNFTVKGIYEKLGDELMFKTKENTLHELHYLLSWTNTSTSNNWNYGNDRILHFTYENYIELLPRELNKMEDDNNNDGSPDGPQALIDEGLYENIYVRQTNTSFEEVDPSAPFIYDSSKRYYGIKAENRIETTDSGSQYPINNLTEKTKAARSDQVPTDLAGFSIENKQTNNKGQIILDNTNTIVDWSDDTNTYRHATIKFFYHRLSYILKWRNGNRLEKDNTRDVMYGAPLNSVYTQSDGIHQPGEYRYWYDGDPVYFNEDLRDYYNFVGWYYTPYYYHEVDKDTATMPADDLTLYAKWDPKIINVSFYPTYNDYYEGINRIGDPVPVHYGDYMEMSDIPANVQEDPNDLRPDLNPPTTGAMFAGWYYLRDNVPVRFDPENVPITALNQEASASEGARLRLYAEWATKDVGKYQVTYVEKDHPENEVADPTTGRSFIWKTKTFNAKGGSDLNEDHAWTEDGINWWPTTNSHSIVIKSNAQGAQHEYEPNIFAFEYVQKRGVYYKVLYLDAATRKPLLDPKDEQYSTHGSIKEDAPFIPGYTAEKMSQSMVLTASTEGTADEQKADELENNVLTFYFNKNTTSYVYEVEYYKQNANDNDYSHYQTENLEIPIADDPETQAVESTYVSLADLYNSRVPQIITSGGFTRVSGSTQVTVTAAGSDPVTTMVADNASVEITGSTKTTIKIYYNRNTYSYRYQYVDYYAEQKYNKKVEDGDDVTGEWNGVLETHDGANPEKVEAEVAIPAPLDLTYDDDGTDVPYTRIDDKEIILTISPTNPQDPDVNLVKIYYKKFSDRELQYKLVCKNENDDFTEVDYDAATGDPLYGGLSLTHQMVESYDQINSVSFYDFNNAQITDENGVLEDAHQHRYTFLGWYDNPEGTGEPLVAYDSSNPTRWTTLTKTDLGVEAGDLPERDTTYYAVVEQDMVRANFEFRYVEEALPVGGDSGETAEDLQAADIVANAPTDADGSYTGSYFSFDNPFRYQSGDPLPYHKTEGYTLSILPKENDDRVYKYEFAEWWEENLNTHKLIRKKNWNSSGEWSPTVLEDQLDRREDKHVIAVYKRRDVESLPYTINYQFTDRFGNLQTFVLKGALTCDQLDESSANCAITSDGDFRLTDEFILENAPYETNYGQTLLWSNRDGSITKTSVKEGSVITKDGEEITTTEDRVYATITAVQNAKTVHAHYRLTPTGAYTQDLQTFYAANYNLDPNMKSIEAPASYNGHPFKYWAVRKSGSDTAPIVAKSLTKLFDLCMMDNYWLSPIYDESAAASGSGSNTVVLVNALPSSGGEDWLAWTWDTSDDGEWVRPDGMTFSGLKTYVIFVRVPAGTAYSAIDWDSNVWNKTDDLTVQNGGTFTLRWYSETYGDTRMFGEWSDTPESTGGDPQEETTEAASVNLTFLDYTRNRWTDEDGNIASSGETDLLFADFEIAFEDNGNQIYKSDDYKTGVILEYCTTVPDYATFDPTRNYGQTTNYDNLAAALTSRLAGENVTQYSYKTGKNRTIQFCEIPTTDLTDHNRVEFGKYIKNAFTVSGTDEEPVYTYKNCSYLLKATAYLVDGDGNVTFSKEPVYVCYKNIASQNSAVPTLIENSSGN